MDAANEFPKHFWPTFQRVVRGESAEPDSALSPLVPSMKAKLASVLCLKAERTVGNDNCV